MNRQFGTAHDEAYLWPVSMRDDHIPTIFDHVSNISHRFFNSIELVWYCFVVFIHDQGIATNGNNSNFFLSH